MHAFFKQQRNLDIIHPFDLITWKNKVSVLFFKATDCNTVLLSPNTVQLEMINLCNRLICTFW